MRTKPPRLHGAIYVLMLSLAGCGSDPTARLVEELHSKDVNLRRGAARELGVRKPEDAGARGALVGAVRDSDAEVRRLACLALGEMRIAPAAVVGPALDDPQFSVRIAAAKALLKTDPENASAVAVLSQGMKAGDGGLIVSVSREGAASKWAVPTLTQLLKDQRPGIRRLAAEGLGQIGPDSTPALPALKQAIKDPDDRVREAIGGAIAKIEAK